MDTLKWLYCHSFSHSIHYTQSRYFLLYGIACICHWNAGVCVRLYAKLRTQYTLCDPVSQADPVENFVLRVICSTLTMPQTTFTPSICMNNHLFSISLATATGIYVLSATFQRMIGEIESLATSRQRTLTGQTHLRRLCYLYAFHARDKFIGLPINFTGLFSTLHTMTD